MESFIPLFTILLNPGRDIRVMYHISEAPTSGLSHRETDKLEKKPKYT